jgi:excisionase family DNA binding protein
MHSTKLTFDNLPDYVWELGRKVDHLTTLLISHTAEAPATPANAPDLLTIKQAAEFVNLAVPTIYGMVGRKEIPVMKRAKKLYFSRIELEAWVKEGRKKTVAECAEEVRDDLKQRGE